MDVKLMNDETLDDLQNGYFLIQKKDSFRFGVDAVLISDFADIKSNDKIVEFGSGTGIIPILLCAKKSFLHIDAIEIQDEMANMAIRSIELNKMQQKITVQNIDIKESPQILGKSVYDVVITNPPYVKKDGGIINPDLKKAIARFEIMCTLEDIVKNANDLLRVGGKLFMVHRADRLVDIIYTMRAYGIEPKRIRFVHPAINKRPHLILIEGAKGGRPELKFLDPLYIYDDKGSYTDEIYRIYGRI